MERIRYRADLYKIVNLSIPGAELGVASGEFSRDILEWGISRLYLVDAWTRLDQTGDGGFDQEWHDDNLHKTKEKIEKYGDRAVILRGLTYQMASHIKDNSLGFVNVDADHSYNGVIRDINAWYPKLTFGGVMAFHDAYNDAYGVMQAVNDSFILKGVKVYSLPENSRVDAGVYIIKP